MVLKILIYCCGPLFQYLFLTTLTAQSRVAHVLVWAVVAKWQPTSTGQVPEALEEGDIVLPPNKGAEQAMGLFPSAPAILHSLLTGLCCCLLVERGWHWAGVSPALAVIVYASAGGVLWHCLQQKCGWHTCTAWAKAHRIGPLITNPKDFV